MIISAKFSSMCPTCNGHIEPGSRVEWSKGEKARHVACSAGVASAAAAPVSPCGSREDSCGDLIPSPRNCESCEHDA